MEPSGPSLEAHLSAFWQPTRAIKARILDKIKVDSSLSHLGPSWKEDLIRRTTTQTNDTSAITMVPRQRIHMSNIALLSESS
jgi:hypothetical protein